MDPTTLVTFMFRAPPNVKLVELLGSWDNFQVPYRMHHDRVRGSDFYTGCFKFENIIFDGEVVRRDKPRTGGLKQGSTYWYYYRLDDANDAFDDRLPITTGCPLLPGQAVNVMEVPCEVQEPPSRSHSACGYDIVGSLTDFTQRKTLDPADKYAHMERPPISKVHSRCMSDDQLDGRLEGQLRITLERAVSPISAPHSRQGASESRPVSPATRDSAKAWSHKSLEVSVSSKLDPLDSPPTVVSRTASDNKAGIPARRSTPQSKASSCDEYPEAYAAPLGSMEALGAALFASSNAQPIQPVRSRASHGTNGVSRRRRDSTLSCGPASVQNVQFYGSRPGTSVNESDHVYQPRTYSIPNSNLSDGSPAASPLSATFLPSKAHDQPDHAQESNSAPESIDGCSAIDELSSPTFTASTVSTGGHNTPFQLSAHDDRDFGYSYNISAGGDPDEPSAMLDESDLRRRPSLFERGLARLRPPFGLNYSLPSILSDSNQSLAKTITDHSRRASEEDTPSLPLPSIAREDEGSMAEAIFSELGFLSSSIT
ncbi:hypothetical protein CBER1_09600 [Cercospora berteroae]|uniref:Uncharacterized protein n=1 Tax=Cercospora berteroae TaxID=357750 RepID=A0A2S6CNN5_9PEZI|nr:hypothetical protein CBER1_09600 [Cercospora berteroae]